MVSGLQTLPALPASPGPLPLGGVVLPVTFGTIVGVTNTNPIVVTTAAPHFLETGVSITISGVVGNTAANGTFAATTIAGQPTMFSISVAGSGAYVSGGVVTANVLLLANVLSDPTTPANQAGVTAGGALKVDASAGTGTPALVAGEAHIGALGGATVAVSGSVVRPANVTAYAAGQVVGTASTDVIAIAGAARKTGGSGVILDALVIDQGGAAASAALELYLFTASPTVQADQTALALVAADLVALVAVVPVAGSYVTNVAATISGSRAYPLPGVNAGFVCAGGSTTLYGVLVQRSAYTPISAESWTVVLQIGQD